jgi:hypothetical protein
MMESIRVRQHIGQDGILRLDIPVVGVTERDVDVMVIYQPVQSSLAESGCFSDRETSPTLADLYGICADDPIALDDQGISEALDDELAGAFD